MIKHLQIGKIVNTHGVRGDVKVIPLTDDPKRFDDLEWVFIEKNSVLEKHYVKDVKYTKGFVLLKLSDIDTVEAAEQLRDCFVLVDRENAVKLPEDTYFICDIIGSAVYDENGDKLGELTDVLKTGSNDVYVVKRDSGKELLLPALKSVVTSVSIENKRIDVIVPRGLDEDEV